MYQSGGFWFLLAMVVVVYWNIPRRWRAIFLAAVSAIYLASFDLRSAIQAIFWGTLFYYVTPGPAVTFGRARLTLSILLVAVIGCLAWYKYLPRLATTMGAVHSAALALPLGISYFTFKLVHYAVEVRRGAMPPHRCRDFLSYLLLFPTFTMGPIERFDHYLNHREDCWSGRATVEGLTRIVHGLVKRFALVDVLIPACVGPLPDIGDLLRVLSDASPLAVWRMLLLSYLYAYLEFSGYSDMAIGASRLFGLRILENFNFPIVARSLAEFWQRWHMTLAGWCQSYIYMPMIGLTRKPYVALYASFLTIGLWHDATWHWLAWGTYHATGVAIFVTWRRLSGGRPRLPPRVRQVCGVVLTQLFVTASYSLTCTYPRGSLHDGLRIFAKLFNLSV